MQERHGAMISEAQFFAVIVGMILLAETGCGTSRWPNWVQGPLFFVGLGLWAWGTFAERKAMKEGGP